MRILLLIAALFAMTPAMAAVDITAHDIPAVGSTAHGDTMGDCQNGGKGAPRHGDCPR